MVEKLLADLGREIAICPHYDNFIGGKWVPAVKGQYFDNISPINGNAFCDDRRARRRRISNSRSMPRTRRRTPGARPRRRSRAHPEQDRRPDGSRTSTRIAVAETIDNGKPIRETMAADIPLAIDHFRYFAGCVRAQEGSHLARSTTTPSPITFTSRSAWSAQIIPWNFPILMAVWKLAPALAAGNCVVLKPAEQTPASHPGADRTDRRPAAAGRAERGQRLRPGSGQAARARTSASPRSPSPARRRPAA